MSFLKIQNLSVDYKLRKETVHAAKDINIEIKRGEIVGLVGESGSGKSTVANAIIDLIDEPGKVSEGSIYLSEFAIKERFDILKESDPNVETKPFDFILKFTISSLNLLFFWAFKAFSCDLCANLSCSSLVT